MKKIFMALCMVAFAVVGCDDDDSWSPSDADNSRSSSVIPGSDPESSSAEKNKSSSSSADKEESSSSSVVLAVPCKTETEDNCEYDSLTDERDGQTYKTVKIGSQWWMAENLNYKTDNSFCYNDSAEYCTKYGRLYTWAAAMDSVGKWSTNGKGCGYYKACSPTYPVRGVCPKGWHLPSNWDEFETLFETVGGQEVAGAMLKSTSGWNSNGDGTDAYGFSAFPAGARNIDSGFRNLGNNVTFWSSTEIGSNVYSMYLNYSYERAFLEDDGKDFALSVRCLKD